MRMTTARIGFLFSLPAILFFLVFILIPVVSTFILSFTQWKGFVLTDISWVGAKNFLEMFTDRVFLKALINTLLFVLITTVLLNLLGFLCASIVDLGFRGTAFLKSAVFFPVLLSPVIIGIMWSRMLDAFGIVNQLLTTLKLTRMPILFLGDERVAIFTVIGATIWQYTGYDTLLYFAGLQGVPHEQVEAARIDGAGPLTITTRIVLPFLSPVIAVTMLLNIIGGFKVFDIVYIMTAGGPNNSSQVFATYLFQQAFRFNRMGYASVIAIVIIAFSVAAAIVRLRVMRSGGG
jgi:raffinose/stachyose/melibiose transport system permease protein